MSNLTSLLDEKASNIAEQVDGFGRETADGLHIVASSIREGSESAAGKLDAAGTYIEKHGAKQALGKSQLLVHRYPAESLFLAAGIGFIAGFAIRRLTHTCKVSQ